MNRRSFLSLVASVPFLGKWIAPKAASTRTVNDAAPDGIYAISWRPCSSIDHFDVTIYSDPFKK